MRLQSTFFGWRLKGPRGIAARLNCIIAIALAAVCALTAAALHFSRAAVEAADALKDAGVVSLVEALEFDTLIERHRRIVDVTAQSSGNVRVPMARNQLDRIEQRLRTYTAARSANHLDQIRGLLPSFTALTDAVLTNAAAGSSETPIVLADYANTAAALHALIDGVRHDAVARMTDRVDRLFATSTSLADWVGVTAVIALILIGPVSLTLLARVTWRLRIIARSMVQLSRSDLDAPGAARYLARAAGPDEIGDMARALAVFRSNAHALRDHRARLEQVNLWLDVALNNMQRGLSMFSPDECLVVCNASYRRMYDLPVDLTMYGTPLLDILSHRAKVAPVDADKIIAGYRAAVADKRPLSYRRSMPDGRIFEISLTPLPAGGWVTVHQDVTQEQQAETRVRLLARQDALTELENRRGFGETLEALTAALPSEGALQADSNGFAVIVIDLDHFKDVNDTHGHPAGDALLVAAAQRLRDVVRQTDCVARMGGDEFAILQRGVRDPEETESLVRRLLRLIAEPYLIHGDMLTIGASIGYTLAPEHGRTPELLMQRADVALYRAKSAGRNTALAFEEALETPIRARREMERDLRAAMAAGEFSLHFQPIVSLETRVVVCCEALLRWRRAGGHFVSPAEFIPLAEEIGLIGTLGAWALEEACRVAASWPHDIKVAVNLSPLQFVQGQALVAQVTMALAKSGLSSRRLELEITESTLLADNATTLATLHALRALGVAIALDDFGTGYSSLSYLRAFPFDKLKIDRSFVRDLPDREDCVAIVKAVAMLASSLNMTTVAEGVETHDHLHRAHLAGCTAVQGYLFSRPVAAAELTAVFADCASKLAA